MEHSKEVERALAELREQITYAMTETAPSWGWRIHRVLAALDLDFGTPESLEWGMLRDHHRVIRWDEDALAAANADEEWPPLGARPVETPTSGGDLLRIDIDDGKYTLIQHDDGATEILRYGDPWLGQNGSFPGVKAVLAMGYELEELRKSNAGWRWSK